jgi:hypothetical protein
MSDRVYPTLEELGEFQDRIQKVNIRNLLNRYSGNRFVIPNSKVECEFLDERLLCMADYNLASVYIDSKKLKSGFYRKDLKVLVNYLEKISTPKGIWDSLDLRKVRTRLLGSQFTLGNKYECVFLVYDHILSCCYNKRQYIRWQIGSSLVLDKNTLDDKETDEITELIQKLK